MGLLVWIPFVHGNCENQGFLNVTTSTVGTITYEDGKIGKAARIGTGSQVTNGISINNNLVEEFGDEYSCAVWIKPTGNHVHYEGAILSSGNWNYKKWAFGVGQNNTTVDPLGPTYNIKMACQIPVNEWTHLVSTVKNNVATVYKNGELVGTHNFNDLVLESDATNTTIGRETYGNGYFSFNGCIQDVRIYNHCLSAQEAKKLARGLMIHYSLSNRGLGGENIIPNTSPQVAQYTYPTNATTFTDKFAQITTVVPSASQYTLSFYAKSTVAGDKVRAHYYSPNTTTRCESSQGVVTTAADGNIDFTLSTEWEYYYVVYTQSSTTAVKHVIFPRMFGAERAEAAKGSGTVSVKCVKFEEGNKPTPWVPNSADTLYSSLVGTNTTEYDLSGYKFNGVRNSITISNDTPTNFAASVFNGSNSYVKCDSNDWMVQGSPEMTVNFWAYSTDWNTYYNRMISCTESGGWNLEPGASGYLRWPLHVYTNAEKTSVAYIYNNSGIKLADLTPGYHMITLIYTTTQHKVYIDSVLHSTYNYQTYGIHYNVGNTRLYLGCESNGVNPSAPYFNGKMSDFRLYCTALNEDAISELYKAGVVE